MYKLSLQIETKDARNFAKIVEVDKKNLNWSRSKAKLSSSKNKLKLEIKAKDINALKSTINFYLKGFWLIEKLLEEV